jgi:hypothetical protein
VNLRPMCGPTIPQARTPLSRADASGTLRPWTRCLPRSPSSSLSSPAGSTDQQAIIDYLLEENRVLRAARGPRRLCFTEHQRRRSAVKGKVPGRAPPRGHRRNRDTRHHPPVVSEARRHEVRWLGRRVAPVARAPGRTPPRS